MESLVPALRNQAAEQPIVWPVQRVPSRPRVRRRTEAVKPQELASQLRRVANESEAWVAKDPVLYMVCGVECVTMPRESFEEVMRFFRSLAAMLPTEPST
jgi:hypothetical protein